MSKIPERKATKKQAKQAHALVSAFAALESNLRIELEAREADQPQSATSKVKDLSDKVIAQYKTGEVDYHAVMEFYMASRVASDLGFMDDRVHQNNTQIVYEAVNKHTTNSSDKKHTRFAVSYVKSIELGTPLDETLLPKKELIPPQSIESRRKAKIEPSKMDTPDLIEEYGLAKEKFEKRNAEGKVNEYTIARFSAAIRAAQAHFNEEGKTLIDIDQHLADLTSIASSDIHRLTGKEFENAKVLRDCAKEDVNTIMDALDQKEAPAITINYDLVPEKPKTPKPASEMKLEEIMPSLIKVHYNFTNNKIGAKDAHTELQRFRAEIPRIMNDTVRKKVTEFLNPKGAYKEFLEDVERIADPETYNARQNFHYTHGK